MRSSPSTTALGGARPSSGSSARNSSPRVSAAPASAPIPSLPAKSASEATVASLRNQLSATTAALSETEQALALATRERQFYFEKLREIEIMVGDEAEPGPGCTMETDKLVGEIRAIMYRTEEGFGGFAFAVFVPFLRF
jgi:RP/EB family microtubule-associated protein